MALDLASKYIEFFSANQYFFVSVIGRFVCLISLLQQVENSESFFTLQRNLLRLLAKQKNFSLAPPYRSYWPVLLYILCKVALVVIGPALSLVYVLTYLAVEVINGFFPLKMGAMERSLYIRLMSCTKGTEAKKCIKRRLKQDLDPTHPLL